MPHTRSKWKFFLVVPILLLFAVCAEFVLFYTLLHRPWTDQQADLVAVFAGANGRAEKGYDLARAGAAPSIVISPASRHSIKIYDRLYGRLPSVRHIIEDQAETTFQNALFVSRLTAQHGMRSIILVTTDIHMPRAYLLFWLELVGSGKTILPCPVVSAPFDRNPLAWSVRQKKQIYNEMVEFWGSLAEKLMYHIHGGLPERSLKQNKIVSTLRRVLLFQNI